MTPCVFCELASDEGAHVASNRYVFVVEDANPKAETHLLVVPRQHVSSFDTASQDTLVMAFEKLRDVARGRGLVDGGYRVVVNVGEGGKQKVPHLHLHLLAGPEVLEDGFARDVG